MSKYSAFSVFRNALSGNLHWDRVWRDPVPKPAYDVVIVGAGGHGLAVAYYLAKENGIHNVAVVEKGWLGGGNTGRNTTIIRSNYMISGNTNFYERSMRLWEDLSRDLNYNAGFYYKTFIGPFQGTWFWMLCEKVIRRAVGMGTANKTADPDEYEKINAHCDVLIIGSGPAGLASALAAGDTGARVILVEQDFLIGGSLLSLPTGDGADRWLQKITSLFEDMGNVQILKRATVFGAYEQEVYGVVEKVWDHVAEPPKHQPRKRYWQIRTTIANAPVRIHRMSYSGELAFEIYIPTGFAYRVWEALMETGKAFDLQPYGTEAMGTLRIEKGHVAGAEIDGRTTLKDLGLEGFASKKKNFSGSVLRHREKLLESSRPTLIGLEVQGDVGANPGALLYVTDKPCEGLEEGQITSTTYSPAIRKNIALALLADGKSRLGEMIQAADFVGNTVLTAKVVSPHFFDPKGERQNA